MHVLQGGVRNWSHGWREGVSGNSGVMVVVVVLVVMMECW